MERSRPNVWCCIVVDVRYDWETGWEGSDLPSVGYVDPLGTFRMFANPQSDKLDDWLFWTAFQIQGLNMFTGWLSGQSYRTMTGIAYEAFVGESAGATLARAAPLGIPIALAVAGSAAQHHVASEHGAGTRGSMGSVSPSLHGNWLKDGLDINWPW